MSAPTSVSASGEKDYAYGYEKGYADGWNACRNACIQQHRHVVDDAREVLAELCKVYIANPHMMGTADYVKCITPHGPRLADSDVGRLWLRAAALEDKP